MIARRVRRMFARARRLSAAPIDPAGRRLLGLTLETGQPIWAPRGHSLLLAAAGGGKTTSGIMPWLFSLLASTPSRAMLILDSKNGEIALQAARMAAELGRKVAVLDDMAGLPADFPHRLAVNPFAPIVSTAARAPEDLIFPIESATHVLIEEPPERDEKNRYFRDWPRNLIEAALRILLRRNPRLATPGGVAALLSDPTMLLRFAAIEAEEGDPALKALCLALLGMSGHEHWPQHLEAAQRALRIFGPGTRLHGAGRGARLTHADLIREGYVICLVGPQAYMNRLGPYYAAHLMAFAEALYAGAGPLDVLADEFTNAPLKPLAEQLTTLRAFGGQVHMVAQSRSEVERRFGRLETLTIEENAIVKQWFGFSSFDEAERVSRAMGEEMIVTGALGSDSESLRTSLNLQGQRQRWRSAAELMAMPADQQLIHIKGLGFFIARKIGQQNIAPYCDLLDPNPLEGGRIPSDPILTLTLPKGLRA